MNSLMCVVSIVLVTMVVGCQKAGGPMERVSERGVLFRTVTAGGIERKYAVYVPREYSPGQPTPLIVFLNGSGECGTDGQKQ